MIVYTEYSRDARVRREAETLASIPEYKVTVLTLKEQEVAMNYHYEGVNVRELNIPRYQGASGRKYLSSYLKFMVLSFLACAGLLFKRSVDILHIHNMPNFLIFSALLPFLFGKKIILDIHDTMLETYLAKYDGKMNQWLYKILLFEESISCAMAHKIICVNHIQRDILLRRGIPGEKTIILLNVPDPKIFNRENNTKNKVVDNGRLKIIYHGTVARRLGVDLAIRAVADLKEKMPNLEFHIIGSGESVQECMRLISDLGAGENIFFQKQTPLAHLVKTLETMDLGIVPNRKNSATELMLPVKMLECMALGIPVVVPRLKTIEYYFSDDMVYYFKPEDLSSLSDSIFNALSNKDGRTKKAQNAMDFLKKYGWENHKYDLINLYQHL